MTIQGARIVETSMKNASVPYTSNFPTEDTSGLAAKDWAATWVAVFIFIVLLLTYIMAWVKKMNSMDGKIDDDDDDDDAVNSSCLTSVYTVPSASSTETTDVKKSPSKK